MPKRGNTLLALILFLAVSGQVLARGRQVAPSAAAVIKRVHDAIRFPFATSLRMFIQLDAFATNDAILFEMADGLQGSRVLPGHWGDGALWRSDSTRPAPGDRVFDALHRGGAL